MASFQTFNFETQIPHELLISQIMQIHATISKLESLRPSKQVNTLFTHLVKLCIPPSSIDIETLPQEVKTMRESLIKLCGKAEGFLELEFSTFINLTPNPMKNLTLFPYYGNYVKLANYENKILKENGVVNPNKVAFIGSGPMPLSSIILATHHMESTQFDNFDIDEKANEVASKIVASDKALEKRMKFVTQNIMEVKERLGQYDCIFLAALVGMSRGEKMKVLGHIRKYMKEGGILLVRSAKGSRAFLYPIVDENDVMDFEVLTIFHPTDDVINSVVLLQKPKA
ncbi:nicotianamine synthase-like protein [Trifolium pratense]|uniref:Nicotianamine synthase n=2 Tax=Trifolium pratense TaxID=57577 RepID=A0A2K3M090_TRIPR|nr:nicotianamine synthase-like protein [Trifolium pratense]